MRLSGAVVVIYAILAACLLYGFLSHVPERYVATRAFALNHRIDKGDFDPELPISDKPRYLASAIHQGEQVTKSTFSTAPIATPVKGNIIIGLDAAIVPKGADAGDMLSLCGASGGEVAAVKLSALDCGPTSAGSSCGALIEVPRDIAAKIVAPLTKDAITTLSAAGSCKPATAKKPIHHGRRHARHARRQKDARHLGRAIWTAA